MTPICWSLARRAVTMALATGARPRCDRKGIDMLKDWLFGITVGLAVTLILIGLLAVGVLLLA